MKVRLWQQWFGPQSNRERMSLYFERPPCCVYFQNLVSNPGLQPSGLAKLINLKSLWVEGKSLKLALCLQPCATRCLNPAKICVVSTSESGEKEKKNTQLQKVVMAIPLMQVPLVTSQNAKKNILSL